ncbi:MAG: hypothetical protein WCR72_14700 [Bacteroidota bacterium]
MIISKKGSAIVIDAKSIQIDKILFVDHDALNVYIVLTGRKIGQMNDENGITIPFASVTSPSTFASAQELHDYLDGITRSGIIDSTKVITLSDSAECVHGYIKVKNNGTGGVIKYTTVDGDTDSDQFDAGRVSEFRVKKVWSTGTAVAVGDIRILS